jgi:hypothetical protein
VAFQEPISQDLRPQVTTKTSMITSMGKDEKTYYMKTYYLLHTVGLAPHQVSEGAGDFPTVVSVLGIGYRNSTAT